MIQSVMSVSSLNVYKSFVVDTLVQVVYSEPANILATGRVTVYTRKIDGIYRFYAIVEDFP